MKKLLLILAGIIIGLQGFGQLTIFPNDSNKFLGRINLAAGKYIYYNGVKLNLTHVGQPQSNIFYWDSVARYYTPWATKQTGIHYYYGVTDPDTTLRLNLNAKLYVGGLGCANTTTKYAMEMWNSGSGRMISGSNTSTGNFLFISNSSTGNAINGTNSSTGRFNSITNSSTGRAFYVAQTGAGQAFYAGVNSAGTGFYGYLGSCTGIGMLLTNVSTGATSGSYITLNRGQTGTNTTSQDFILVTDNPTTSGTITGGKVLEVTEGSDVRLLLHPRVPKTGTPVAYNLGTYWNLTSGYLLQLVDSGTVKASIAYDGSINISSGARYLRNGVPIQRPLADFYTDASTSGTGETDLYSYTTLANTLANNGDKIVASYTVVGDGSALGYVDPYFAGTNLYASAIVINNNATLILKVEIIRVSSTVARCAIQASAATTYQYTHYVELTSKDWTTTNIIKITGTASAGTITAKMGSVQYIPVAQ